MLLIMAEYEHLQAQAEVAYAASLPFLISEDWIITDSSDEFITSIIPASDGPILKVEGEINKDPQFILRYLPENIQRIRATAFIMYAGLEQIAVFEDSSRITREVVNVPSLGEIVQYRYNFTRIREDGSVMTVSTSAITPTYPAADVNLVFSIMHVESIEGGKSHVSLITQSSSNVPIEDEAITEAMQYIDGFYRAILMELKNTPAE